MNVKDVMANSPSNRDNLIAAVKDMATACGLQNCEQISEERGATGAVRMIQREYIDLRERYFQLLKDRR
jgi:limonene-1,2-epoxide hydrolase